MLAPRLALLLGAARAFYLPGVAPREYGTGERVELKVNKLTSTKTQAGDDLRAPVRLQHATLCPHALPLAQSHKTSALLTHG